jgi:hypothetical protein
MSPGSGCPSTDATAPEKIHGCPLSSEASRPGLRIILGYLALIVSEIIFIYGNVQAYFLKCNGR